MIAICVVLGLNYEKDNLLLFIFQNLQKGNLLKVANDNDHEDDGNDEEDDDEDEDDKNAECNDDVGESEVNVRADNIPSELSNVSQGQCDVAMSKFLTSGEVDNKFKNVNTGQHRFTMNFRDIEESVRIFDRSSNFPVERWVEECEETAVIMEWDDFQEYVFAKKVLKGVALLFIRSESGLTSWQKLKNALIQEFKTVMNSAQIHKDLAENKMKKSENV